MTPTSNSGEVNLTTVAVALGRLEAKLDAMAQNESKTDDRLDKVESRLSTIEINLAANVRPRLPWYVWVSGIGGILLLGINGIAMVSLLTDIAGALP